MPGRARLVVVLPAVRRGFEIDALAAPLGGRVDARLLDRVQRPLGEGREGAHLLDLVPEELDAQRLAAGRGEDVDDASAHGELASLLDPVDALVAGARERLGEAVEAGLLADHEPHRLRSRGVRRHPLGERRGRRADEPAGGEDVEGAGALADEVRRRLEAGGVRDAAAREQRDAARRRGTTTRPRPRRARPRPRGGGSAARAPSSSCSAARTSGSAGSETRARAGSALVNAWKRSLAASSAMKA